MGDLWRRWFVWIAASFILLSAAFSYLSQNGVSLDGDGPYYLLMQQAFLRTGAPAFTSDLIASILQRPDIAADFKPDFLNIDSHGLGRCYHFWAYSLISVPAAAILEAFGADPLPAFFLVNAAFACAAVVLIARNQSLSLLARTLLIGTFGVTTVNWYAAWPHPEVMTAALALMASLALVERRWLICACCAGLGALQNPSVALIIPIAGLTALLNPARPGLNDPAELFSTGWKLAVGALIALVAPVYSIATQGTANPIVEAGFVEVDQITPYMLGQYLFDLNQGGIIGLPFLFIGTIVAVVLRLRSGLANAGLLRRHDWLLLCALALTLPVLAQTNFNSGQYFVLRYVAWTLAPALVWLAYEIDLAPRALTAAWLGGAAIYGLIFVVFLVGKFSYVLEARADPTLPPYCDWCRFKPWTTAVVDRAPGLYDPLPGLFAERVGGVELESERRITPPIVYVRSDGVLTKVLTTPDRAKGDPRACASGVLASDSPPPKVSETLYGLVYLNGAMRCAPAG